MIQPTAYFFNTVRPMFGRLTQGQVDGMNKIVQYAQKKGVPRAHLAYMLATVQHETANWMQPIREGARRKGPAYTDAQSRHAIAVAVGKGLIRRNYALPHPVTKLAYYGRGLVQITHAENYKRLGEWIGVDLFHSPDKALDWEPALDIMYIGMTKGLFTGKDLSMIDLKDPEFVQARRIINGDVRTQGKRVAKYATVYYAALKDYKPGKGKRWHQHF